MRSSPARLLAAAQSKPLRTALLPALPLYRRLLRSHRKHLPSHMRLLGDEYIKAEFRAHRNVDNLAQIIGFLSEWQDYLQKIEGDSWVGEKIDQDKLAKMSNEQVTQLYELMQAIQAHQKGEDG